MGNDAEAEKGLSLFCSAEEITYDLVEKIYGCCGLQAPTCKGISTYYSVRGIQSVRRKLFVRQGWCADYIAVLSSSRPLCS